MREVKRSKTFGRKTKPNKLGFSKFEIAKLELREGDILVLRTDLILTREQAESLKARINDEISGVKVMVLTGGLSLAVLQDKRAA